MSKKRDDDLHLLFDTEKRILKRRLKEMFPGRSTADLADETHPPTSKGTAGRRQTEASGRDKTGEPILGGFFTRGLYFSLSVLSHVLLIAILYPFLITVVPDEDEELQVTVRWVERDTKTGTKKEEEAPKPIIIEKPQPKPVEIEPPKPDPLPEPSKGDVAEKEASLTAQAEKKKKDPLLGLTGGGEVSAGEEGGRGSLETRFGDRASALTRHGGSAETEQAVSEGLRWLARHQDRDGSWDPHGFNRHCSKGRRCGGPGFEEFRAGLTSLCLLAFMGAGVDGRQPHEFQDNVKRGLDYVLSTEDAKGCFGRDGKKYMYNHGIAVFCLAEAYIVTGEQRFKDAVTRGLEFAASCQQPGGGWDYTITRTLRNDLSVTGWIVMAIHTAREAGILYDSAMHKRLRKYITKAVTRSGEATYANSGTGAGRKGISIAAVGMLCKLYLDWSPRSHELKRSADRIMRRPPDADGRVHWEREFQSSYYWYYATLSLFHMGGDVWEAWNILLKRELLPLQRKRGEKLGSWDPDPNWLGSEGGRIATTALSVLCLEVYYRYQPIYEKYGIKRKD